ncbi:carbohydrate kinase family protein [Candidatus Daviesbacteria bacterium]|nr:carbohydrate kinase family protein [Candidatus Daviesbacteria bacterium]
MFEVRLPVHNGSHHKAVEYPRPSTSQRIVVVSEPILDETLLKYGSGINVWRDHKIVITGGDKIFEKPLRREWGGPGIYVPTAIAKDGHEVTLHGIFGKDGSERDAIEVLVQNGVRVVPIKILETSPKAAVNLVSSQDGTIHESYVSERKLEEERVFCEGKLVGALIHQQELAKAGNNRFMRLLIPMVDWVKNRITHNAEIPQINLVYLTSVRGRWEPAWEGALNFIQSNNIPLAVHFGSYQRDDLNEIAMTALAMSDYYVANKAEAIGVYNKINGTSLEGVDTIDLLRALYIFGGKRREVMITEAQNGFTTLDLGGTAYYSRPYGYDVVNPNGAGDNASGIFISSRLHGFDNPTTNKRVGIAANRIIGQEGALGQYTYVELNKAIEGTDYSVEAVYSIEPTVFSVAA